MSRLRVAYYISSHGFGHASRAAQIMAALPSQCEIFARTLADPEFLARESGREVTVERLAFDFGAWQRSNMSIDWDKTFETAMAVHAASHARLDAEVDFLRRTRIDIVVSDIPPTPLLAAARAGLPSVCVANFTWVEVFRRAAREHAGRQRFLRELVREYGAATMLLRPGFALRMPYFRRRADIPYIARRGRSIRRALTETFAIPRRNRLVLTYFGKWGLDELALERLSRLVDVTFLSFDADVEPFVRLSPSKWKFEDVVASVDAVLAKPGYGTMGECMANGTPVIYYPRSEFSEYFALRRELERWGGAVRLSSQDFAACRWGQALDRALELRPPRVRCEGAHRAAQWIVTLARG